MTLEMQRAAFEFTLFALCNWREARGELLTTKQAQAWSVKNRVLNPRWWGGASYSSVILMPWQYSSFNHNDPNAVKWPVESDPSWQDSMDAVSAVLDGTLPDPTHGSVSYFDMSMDSDPPSWALSPEFAWACDFGRLHFYKLT
jgi:hypothetical protein